MTTAGLLASIDLPALPSPSLADLLILAALASYLVAVVAVLGSERRLSRSVRVDRHGPGAATSLVGPRDAFSLAADEADQADEALAGRFGLMRQAVTGAALPVGPPVAVVTFAKAGNESADNEDAAAAAPGIAVVSDGASSAFDAGRWARHLSQASVVTWPGVEPEQVRRWLLARAAEFTELNGSQKADGGWLAEATEGRPACATLAAVRWIETPDGDAIWQAIAIGDSIVVQLRQSRGSWSMVTGFPAERAAAIEGTPELICSSVSGLDDVPSVRVASGAIRAGDALLAMTDECARWALGSAEAGVPIWDFLLEQDAPAIEAAVRAALSAGLIVNDDITCVRLRHP
jgi:hypothetical protein